MVFLYNNGWRNCSRSFPFSVGLFFLHALRKSSVDGKGTLLPEEVQLTVNGDSCCYENLIVAVNSRYSRPFWKRFSLRHEIESSVRSRVVHDTFFEKHETGLDFAETLFQQAISHSTVLKGDVKSYLDNFLVPKLNSFLVRFSKGPTEAKTYSEYVVACISNSYLPKLDIRWIGKTVGWGLFAAEDILLFEFIGLYTGELCFLDELPSTARGDNGYLYVFPKKTKGLVVNSQLYGNHTRFINHSTAHNVFCINVSINKVPYMAILSSSCPCGGQILWNYGEGYTFAKALPMTAEEQPPPD
eukprot:RCo018612